MKQLYLKIHQYLDRLRSLCISYTHTKYAELVLYSIAFLESFIFPIPPDVMLLPMVFARITYSFRYAFGSTCASVLGGSIGYAIGFFFFSSIGMWIIDMYSLHAIYASAEVWFQTYGVLTMLIAGITPLPYKLATILAGMFHFSFSLFLITSFLGRGMRFFFIALLPYIRHTSIFEKIKKNLGILFLFVLVFFVGVLLFYALLIGR